MTYLKTLIIVLSTMLSMSGCKELQPVLDQVKPLLQTTDSASSVFSSQQLAAAIKQALDQGVGDSVSILGRDRGFSASDVYRIKIPDSLRQPADVLRQLGQGKRVKEFESRLNLAAERSVAKAIPVFSEALRNMSVSDALGIMQGTDNAATRYFRDRTETKLRSKFLPIIQSATSETGLTRTYKTISDKIATYVPQYKSKLVDIDDYVLSNAMDALFDRIAIEEKLIRDNPAKRSTELMKSVFGHFAKSKS